MKDMFSARRCVALALRGFIFSLLLVVSAAAQTGTSSVRGTVADPQGNVVPGATVTLLNTDINLSRTTTTSDDGSFAFELIPPGTYRVEAEAPNFKKTVVTDVRALVAKPTEVSLALEVGNVSETVTVASNANEALLNTQDATLGNNFVSQQITQLPLEARNIASLLTLQPGVTRTGYVAGARSDQSNVTLDGVDINEAQNNQIGSVDSSSDTNPSSGTVLRLNAEAIEEFRVTTVNANAQAGRSSGAQISLITKGGSNDFRGVGFWFHRPTILTSNDFFNNRSGIERPTLIRNTFGGALGGPIIKDRAFFFYSFEGRRDRSQTSVLSRVPLASLGRGELRYENAQGGITTLTAANIAQIFPGLNGVNPAAQAVFAAAAARYPANDFGSTGDSFRGAGGLVLLNTAGYRFNASQPIDLNSHVARFDLNLTKNQTVFARANVIYDLIAGTPVFPDTPRPDTWSHPWGLAVGHTWTLSSRFVNRFTYGLTREAFTQGGDAAKNEVYFRFVFFPVLDSRTINRTTPTHNITDDFSWVAGNHTAQFGTNIRIIRNRRTTFANAFDVALTNPSYYANSGTPLFTSVNAFSPAGNGQTAVIQNAVSALLGRLTQYTARFTFDLAGNPLPPGTPTNREFATEEYDLYGQDSWKVRPNLTVTYGLRYGLSRPIYETQGYETKPNIALSEYFRRRQAASLQGQNYDEPLLVELSGPVNGKESMYPWDKNNFQPRLGVAWSPNFKSRFLGGLFGRNSESVIRGGFAITNDYIGQALAVRFDLNNALGFSSETTSPPGQCNTTDRPCPLFTSFSQDVRGLPGIAVPGRLTFPQSQPQDLSLRIESSLDEEIKSPTNYQWSLTFERELPKGLMVQAAYVGRLGRNLLASRDVMMPNNITDPQSSMDWYTAAGMLEDIRRNFANQGITGSSPRAVQQEAIRSIAAIPYFENLFGSIPLNSFARSLLGGSRSTIPLNATQAVLADALIFNGNDWSLTQVDIDGALLAAGRGHLFYQSQYGALSAFSTIANSDYHAGTLSIRQRLGNSLTADFNYTLSKSMDDASGLQNGGSFGAAFILNPLRQRDNYSVSDFDVRHIINANAVWQLPVGRGRWLNIENKFVNAVVGGWQMSGIYRWNSGLPLSAPFDDARWATNWQVQSNGVRTRPIEACPTRGGTDAPAVFCNREAAYQSFRNPKPGETGDRNVFRLPGYVVLDMGMSKTFGMPWSETQKLQLRFEAFNVTNTQRMGSLKGGRDGYGLVLDPQNDSPPSNWSNFSGIQGDRRVMQFGFRFEF
ncbi:MAG TPA: TonB-dependent receptor [Pyrinomonadaceae bacterium]|nr:TonB-dependent receptor [Pyrinomonadaceae bacterium]